MDIRVNSCLACAECCDKAAYRRPASDGSWGTRGREARRPGSSRPAQTVLQHSSPRSWPRSSALTANVCVGEQATGWQLSPGLPVLRPSQQSGEAPLCLENASREVFADLDGALGRLSLEGAERRAATALGYFRAQGS